MIGLVVSFGFMSAIGRTKGRAPAVLRVLAALVVVTFVAVSIAKLPSYIGGDMSPLRGVEPIDGVPYWRVDPTNFAAAQFLEHHGRDQLLYTHMLVPPYTILSLYARGMRQPPTSLDSTGKMIPGSLQNDGLIVLQDKVEGRTYTFRQAMPPTSAYDGFSQVYSDGDLIIYLIQSS